MHSLNPGASFAGFLGTTSAGLLLGYGYLVTGRLWLPIAFHFAWNFAEGTLFSFPVSGAGFPGLLVHKYSGPMVWTGGTFGPEAGILTPLVLIVGVLIVRLYARTAYRSGSMVRIAAVEPQPSDAGAANDGLPER